MSIGLVILLVSSFLYSGEGEEWRGLRSFGNGSFMSKDD